MGGEELSVDKVIRITNPKAEELIQKFDEHTIDKCHKFGVIYQQKGQVRISYACTWSNYEKTSLSAISISTAQRALYTTPNHLSVMRQGG